MKLKSPTEVASYRAMILQSWQQLIQSGEHSEQAATTLGYTARTLKEWRRRFEARGMARLCPISSRKVAA